MTTRGGELIALNELTVVVKPLLDPIAVQRRERNGRLASSSKAYESDWKKALSIIDQSRPGHRVRGCLEGEEVIPRID